MTDTPTPTGGIGHGSINPPREVRTVADLYAERDRAESVIEGLLFADAPTLISFHGGYITALDLALKVIAEQS